MLGRCFSWPDARDCTPSAGREIEGRSAAGGPAACFHLRLLQCHMGQEGERRRREDGEVEAMKTNPPDCKFLEPKILVERLGLEGVKGTNCPL
ncbi:hypothetical protein FQA47_005062 [Oryzias melastigma]|uniref:Uncharacterized protein n=1 Tax=Oryzias melastigma TaxID=30732 RepID=A0A834L2Y2_ORYME|nr:hypothetical protein FQA47_005062 [Oryzias melastigma]